MLTPRRTELTCWVVVASIAGVHLASFFPFVHIEPEASLFILFAAIATCALMCLATLADGRTRLSLEAAPRWVRWGFAATFAYSLLTFVLHDNDYRGIPKVVDSGFVLVDHGRILKTIDEAEYWRAARADVRFWFGVMLMFAYWGAAGYTFGREPIPQSDERQQ